MTVCFVIKFPPLEFNAFSVPHQDKGKPRAQQGNRAGPLKWGRLLAFPIDTCCLAPGTSNTETLNWYLLENDCGVVHRLAGRRLYENLRESKNRTQLKRSERENFIASSSLGKLNWFALLAAQGLNSEGAVSITVSCSAGRAEVDEAKQQKEGRRQKKSTRLFANWHRLETSYQAGARRNKMVVQGKHRQASIADSICR